jgi:peroxiredoxin Q/BCP
MVTSLLPVIGKPAPDFTLPSSTGEPISLRQFKGRKTVILYFYPKDETPGCTREACDFRDHATDFERFDTVILGVSTDGLESHQRFRDKHHLTFPLLADEDATVAKQYGVYKQRNLYGKKYMGIERTTFVIDRTGRIAQIYPKVKVEGHIQQLLEFVGND